MTVSFVPPVLYVLEDRRVTTIELDWLTQELIMVTISAVMMAAFLKLTEVGIQ